ncbi:hypothetical protein LX36DRAFT_714467 [Colletotrichum falcatum]|nr:hypothetical protein LX36DRAFT_714467 [Colletotrichum falcatum]
MTPPLSAKRSATASLRSRSTRRYKYVASVLSHTHPFKILVNAGANTNTTPLRYALGAAEQRRKPMRSTTAHLEWQGRRHSTSLGPRNVLDWANFTGANVHNVSALHDLSRHLDGPPEPKPAIWPAGRPMAQDGLDINASTDRGMTPLVTACAAGQLKLAHRLLSLGADRNAGVPTRPTETLPTRGTTDVRINYLLGRDEAFRTALGLVPRLIDKEVAADATDSVQQTALHVAASIGELRLVEGLLRDGASPGTRDVFGAVPFDPAKMQSPLLTATRRSLGLDSDTWHLRDDAGKTLFRLLEIHTAQATSRLR